MKFKDNTNYGFWQILGPSGIKMKLKKVKEITYN